jgi:RNase H
LLVAPPHAKITINTDSSAVIERFNSLVTSSHLRILPRQYFKSPTNNFLWAALCDIVNCNNLRVSFTKVVAHSGVYFNERVDSLAKLQHSFSNAPVFNLKLHSFSTLLFVPLWNNIPIESHLRHFITDLSRVNGFESFLNLHRNRKYRSCSIDWSSTFMALSDDEPASHTSFSASYRKAHKIKFLLEELPTVEHVKLRRPDLYRDWNCPVCNDSPETFTHIWTCHQHRATLASICLANKKSLVALVREHSLDFSFSHLSHSTLWSLDFDSLELTFLDILKGIVPAFLPNKINSFIRDKKITTQIISIFLNNIYLDCMNRIWLPRCDSMILKEQHLGISSRTKKRPCPRYTHRTTVVRPSRVSASDYDSLRDSIYFGGDWLGFTTEDNHVIALFYVGGSLLVSCCFLILCVWRSCRFWLCLFIELVRCFFA